MSRQAACRLRLTPITGCAARCLLGGSLPKAKFSNSHDSTQGVSHRAICRGPPPKLSSRCLETPSCKLGPAAARARPRPLGPGAAPAEARGGLVGLRASLRDFRKARRPPVRKRRRKRSRGPRSQQGRGLGRHVGGASGVTWAGPAESGLVETPRGLRPGREEASLRGQRPLPPLQSRPEARRLCSRPCRRCPQSCSPAGSSARAVTRQVRARGDGGEQPGLPPPPSHSATASAGFQGKVCGEFCSQLCDKSRGARGGPGSPSGGTRTAEATRGLSAADGVRDQPVRRLRPSRPSRRGLARSSRL